MTARRVCLSALLLSANLTLFACREAAKPAAEPPLPTWMLGEHFPIGVVSCRVDEAQARVTEARDNSGTQRVSPDVHVLTVSLVCQTGAGEPVSPQSALPPATVILLSSAQGTWIAPTSRTWLNEEQPELLVFEVPVVETFVARTRRFDAVTGQRKTTIDTRFGKLVLQTPQQKAEILLRERGVDGSFERALDRLMMQLAQGAATQEGALQVAHDMHRSIMEHAAGRQITAQPVRSAQGLPLTLTLSYDQSARELSSAGLRTLRLELAPSEDRNTLLVQAIADRELLERALRCERERYELGTRAASAYATHGKVADCHVLGLLLPGPCDATDQALLTQAVDVLGRCIEPKTLRAKGLPPADFQLTLRRGRTSSALDRTPRYTVALFAEGQVVFHGRHWVNSLGRSDGRTSPQALAGLYQHMRGLDWFDRKGGEWSADDCSTDDEQGNVVTLHAGGRERMILDRPGCRGPFSEQELDELRVLIEAAAGVSSFTRQRAMYADPEAQIWTVQ